MVEKLELTKNVFVPSLCLLLLLALVASVVPHVQASNPTQLDNSVWTVYYYTKLAWTYIPKQEIEQTKATFYWGTTTYNSHIQSF